ncbi:MAG TPA: PEGA domain-containing protein [Patescibacteria group bacterium]|nr:PEGA domain-containing protein [Patescibacteria group bacterium]
MVKVRLWAFILSVIIVGSVGTLVSLYARGYRFDFKALKFQPNGILVIKSEPDGASVFVDGDLKTATNATISLSPGTYDVEVRRDGFFTWYKRLTIEKEVVTQANVSLFRNVPSLSPVTFSGAVNPTISLDGGKIAYSVLPGVGTSDDKIGLWTLDTFSLPLGFSNDPKRITDGDLTNTSYAFSPDGRQIMLTTSNGIFVLDAGSFKPQNQRVNIASQKLETIRQWQKEKSAKDISLIRNLPAELTDILTRKSSDFVFSPDQNMILYTASSAGVLTDKLIKPLPGASTQREERTIQTGHTYIYDIKEDRNFLVYDQAVNLSDKIPDIKNMVPAIRWMSTSRHLLLAQPGQIVIMDYDGTNREVVYSGSYISTFAFPFNNTTRLLILTNLGGINTSANLYTLTIK